MLDDVLFESLPLMLVHFYFCLNKQFIMLQLFSFLEVLVATARLAAPPPCHQS